MNPSPKRLATLRVIMDYIDQHGYPPTYDEIAESLGRSKTTIYEHVHDLVELGVLSINPHKARSIKVMGEPGTCPLCKQKTKGAI